MSLETIGILLIVGAALCEAPLYAVIAGLTVVSLIAAGGDWLSLQIILIEMNRLASMPVLTALPLFALAGVILSETQAPRRIMNLVEALVGWLPGGMAIAALCSCAFFTALTGASGVTIVAMGGILYPVLRERGYGEIFNLGLLTTSGSLGLLFPPSLPIILYGVISGLNIQDVFKAALVPGVLLVLVLSLFALVYRLIWAGGADHGPKQRPGFSRRRLQKRLLESRWDWPIPILLVVGVYGGFVTIAEVSAVIVAYVILVECVILKEIDVFKQLPGIVVEAAILSGAIIVILGFALGFTGFLVDQQVPNRILKGLTALTTNKYLFLLGLNLFLLAVGCMMDIFSAIVIIVPVIVPVAVQYGVDPMHLCVIFLVNLEIGYSTPPVGINLFIASLKFDRPVTLLYRASLPYLALLLGMLALITYVPGLSLMLVR